MPNEMNANKRRSPNIKRYVKIARDLQNSLLNAGSVEWIDTTKIDNSSQKFNMVDLFCGCGGLTLGFELAGFTSIFGIDIDTGTSATYRYNFPDAIQWEMRVELLDVDDIKKVIGNRQIHVLCAGFPCPGFSIAGLKNPNDPRNYLYKEVVRITKGLKPWFIVLENVPRLVTLKQFLLQIYKDFNNIGYKMSVLIHESAKYGVPQIRPRTIFIGNRFGLKNPHPKPILSENEYVSIEEAIDDLKNKPRNPRFNHAWTDHSDSMIKRISEVPPGGSLYKSYVDAWKRQYRGVPSMTVKENHGGNHIHYELNRVLSAREMARLQSFPDNYIFEGTMKRTLFQIGNAVPPLLAKHIALALRPSLKKLATKHESLIVTSNNSDEINISDSRVRTKFEKLRSRLGKDLRGIWDVYIYKDREHII